MSLTNTIKNWWYGLGGKFPETIRWDSVSGQGSQGKTVAMWQTVIGVTPDGSFGPQTDALTRTWQSAHGIDPDGVVGPLTWTAAFKGVGKAGTPSSGGPPAGTRPLPQSVANNAAITAFAIEVLNNRAVQMGETASRNVNGVQVMARIEGHSWTHRNGKLVTGLNPPIRGVTLYQIVDSAMFAGEGDPFFLVSQHGGEYSVQRYPGGWMSMVGSYEDDAGQYNPDIFLDDPSIFDSEAGCSDVRGDPKKYKIKK